MSNPESFAHWKKQWTEWGLPDLPELASNTTSITASNTASSSSGPSYLKQKLGGHARANIARPYGTGKKCFKCQCYEVFEKTRADRSSEYICRVCKENRTESGASASRSDIQLYMKDSRHSNIKYHINLTGQNAPLTEGLSDEIRNAFVSNVRICNPRLKNRISNVSKDSIITLVSGHIY